VCVYSLYIEREIDVTHVLKDLNRDFSVRKTRYFGWRQRHAKPRRDLAREIWVGVARDELQLALLHDARTSHHTYNRKKNGPTIRIYMTYESHIYEYTHLVLVFWLALPVMSCSCRCCMLLGPATTPVIETK